MLQWFSNIPQDMFPLMSDRNLAPHVSGIVTVNYSTNASVNYIGYTN